MNDEIFGFEADNHAEGIVCAAVSILILNTVNSIECFTEEDLVCDSDDDGGYLKLVLPQIEAGGHNHDVNLLLNSMMLGLDSIISEYPGEINLMDKT